MKKFTLSLLVKTIFILNTFSNNVITNIGPLQLTYSNQNIFGAGSIILWGNIKIGNSNTDTINIQGAGITNPSSGNNSFIMINSSGNIITSNTTNSNLTCSALTASSISTSGTLNSGVTTTGTLTSGNHTCGSLTAASTAGQTVSLGNTTGTITLTSSGITNPTSGNNSFAMINSSGNIITSNTTNSNLTCSALTASSISTSGTLTCGALTPNSITTTGALSCGSLTAASTAGQTISLGTLSAGNNYIYFTNNSGGISILSSAPSSFFSIQTNGNITLLSSSITWPSSGYMPLYIGNNGILTTNTSSKKYKENIKKIQINNQFDLIQPVAFNYINDATKNIQYGYIAEDLINIPLLKDAVIYDQQGNPLSINYQAVFVLLSADYLATKKALRAQLLNKDILLNTLKNRCDFLENQLQINNEALNQLELKYQLLENFILKMMYHMPNMQYLSNNNI